jgi:glycerol-3-phosphate dehydrogenase
MKRQFDGLSNERFDLVVIGGGVIGTGVARDAALRGIKTLLVEKEDFAYGTTSRSTRLVHGGLRYLSHLDFKLVRQDLREREVLLRIAPNLVKPLAFLLPLTSFSQHAVMGAGMRLYDMLSFDKSVPSYRHLSKSKTEDLEPRLKIQGLKGSYQFYDCQIAFPERLCIDNAISAAEHGSVMVNHAQVIGMGKTDGAVDKVRIKDGLSRATREVETRCVISVAGHWSNDVLSMAIASPRNEIRTTMGVHLVTPKMSNGAIVLFAKSDGRLIFVIPWEGYSLIGTTDTEYSGDKDYVAADAAQVSYLVKEVNVAFPDLRAQDIYWAFAGLRSLVGSRDRKVSDISRAHKLVDHEVADGVKGLVSILGGKLTGYRAIAQEAVDLVSTKLGVNAECKTAETPLPGAPGCSEEELNKMQKDGELSLETLAHLNSLYGSRMGQVVELANADESGRKPICSHSKDIVAQIWHAVKEESCATAADFMLRRGTTGLCSCQGLDAVETVAVEMGRMLGWSIGEWQSQVGAYRDFVAASSQFKRVLFAP